MIHLFGVDLRAPTLLLWRGISYADSNPWDIFD